MTQAYPGQPPTPWSGSALATAWGAYDTAVKSGQLGAARPAGIEKGGVWSRDNGDGTVTLMLYDGATDIEIKPNVVLRISQESDASALSTISTTDVSISQGLTYSPVAATSMIRVDMVAEYYTEAPDDPRAQVRMTYYDGTQYVAGGNVIVIGGLNVTPAAGNARIYGTVSDTVIYSPSARRSDNGNLSVRLYGSVLDAGTSLQVYSYRATFTEYLDA